MQKLLKNRFTLYQKNNDIAEFFNGIPLIINKDFLDNNIHYYEKVDKIPKGKYILCDLENTFTNELLMEKVIEEFLYFLFNSVVFKKNKKKYICFLYDFWYFNKFLKNKVLGSKDFLLICEYFIFSYKECIIWDDFLKFLENSFDFSKILLHQGVVDMIKKSLGDIIFITWVHSFIADIYIWKFMKKQIDNKEIHYFSSYLEEQKHTLYNLWNYEQKKSFITFLLHRNTSINIIGGIWDSIHDLCFFNFCEKKNFKIIVNPTKKILEKIHLRRDGKDIQYFITKDNILVKYNHIVNEVQNENNIQNSIYFYQSRIDTNNFVPYHNLWCLKDINNKFYYDKLFFFYKWWKSPQTGWMDDYHINSSISSAKKFANIIDINIILRWYSFDCIVVIPTKRNMINTLILNNVTLPIIVVKKDKNITFSSRKTDWDLKKIIYSRRVFSIENIKKYNNILLIDDVFRTGTTLNEVSRKIKEQWVERITCLCYFYK